MTVLLLDNYDSFTFMLQDYILQSGVDCEVIRNDHPLLDKVDPSDYEGLVISPGPGTPAESGKLMELLGRFVKHEKPVLGICLGHQAIAEYFGAKVVVTGTPRHGKTDKMTHSGGVLFEGVPQTFEATRYHSLVVKDLPQVLTVNCVSGKEIMGLFHRHLPLFGLQFHPESCCTEYGLQMIKNFTDLLK